jgi:hypothetical protein
MASLLLPEKCRHLTSLSEAISGIKLQPTEYVILSWDKVKVADVYLI